MNQRTMKVVWGIIVILLGIFLLLMTTDVLKLNISTSWLFSFLFFLAFIFFIGMYISMERQQFWPLIPGIIMLGLALLIISEAIGLTGTMRAGLFILLIGLSFLAVFIFHPSNWWAVIPAGMIASVSLLIFFGNLLGVGLMLLGMGFTFIALYFLLLSSADKHWWPLIPGSILAFMGLLFLFFGPSQFGNYVLPIALIIVGIILILPSLKRREITK